MSSDYIAIVLAAGAGTRFAGSVPKQFTEISGETMAYKALSGFLKFEEILTVLLVIGGNQRDYLTQKIIDEEKNQNLRIVLGGSSRGESIQNALSWAMRNLQTTPETKFIIHDSCRPFVSTDFIRKLLDDSKSKDALITFQTTADASAIKRKSGEIETISPGDAIISLNTPVIISSEIATELLSKRQNDFSRGLASLLIDLKCSPSFVESDGSTRKITRASDLVY